MSNFLIGSLKDKYFIGMNSMTVQGKNCIKDYLETDK